MLSSDSHSPGAGAAPEAAGGEAAGGDEEVYPFFIGEAAYYEPTKDIAFMLSRKEQLPVSLPAGATATAEE